MKSLQVLRLKPNPLGKDRHRTGSIDRSQLAAEWVDIKNVGSTGVDLAGVGLYHLAFSPAKPNGEWALVLGTLTGVLPPNTILCVHAGAGNDTSVIRMEDRNGADYHVFLGHDQYVWTNKEGDTAGIWDSAQKAWIDQASYDPNPPEGIVLVRYGNKLVPSATANGR